MTIFRRFPTIFLRFPKIFQNWPECRTNVSEHFPKSSGHFSKTTEDCRRRPKKIRRCFGHTPTNLSLVKGSKHHSSGTDIFTYEDIISSHVWISYRFHKFVTTRYTTDFYTINRGYYTVARRYEFYFRVAKQYFMNERSE